MSRIKANFRLISDDLDPETVTQRLGITPTKAWAKGSVRPTKRTTGRPFIYRTGMWHLTSEMDESASLDEHLSGLLDQLDDSAAQIRAFVEAGYEADFFCGVFMERWNEGDYLSPNTLQRISGLNAEVILDMYDHWDAPTLRNVVQGWWWKVSSPLDRWHKRRQRERNAQARR